MMGAEITVQRDLRVSALRAGREHDALNQSPDRRQSIRVTCVGALARVKWVITTAPNFGILNYRNIDRSGWLPPDRVAYLSVGSFGNTRRKPVTVLLSGSKDFLNVRDSHAEKNHFD